MNLKKAFDWMLLLAGSQRRWSIRRDCFRRFNEVIEQACYDFWGKGGAEWLAYPVAEKARIFSIVCFGHGSEFIPTPNGYLAIWVISIPKPPPDSHFPDDLGKLGRVRVKKIRPRLRTGRAHVHFHNRVHSQFSRQRA